MELRSATKADFSITLEDRPGALAALSLKMQEAGIELLGLWGSGDQSGSGKLYCVPKNAKQFRDFAKSQKLKVEEGLTIYLSGADRGGALVESLELIAQAGINNQSHVPLQVLIGEAHAACAMLDQSPTTEQWHAAVDMIAAGPGSFSKTDARTIGQAGVNSYCRNYTQLSNT